ncbi:hypothetical protein I8G32_02077 [Rhodopseudomonas palustris]|nr:hypothetical protein I8G32_02077 [Rhodopseudomonas palustris]
MFEVIVPPTGMLVRPVSCQRPDAATPTRCFTGPVSNWPRTPTSPVLLWVWNGVSWIVSR